MSPSPRAPDAAAMARATRDFLAAAGIDPEHPDFAATAERVAATWCESFLDGYAAQPAEILGESFPHDGGGSVVVRDVAFHSTCPHHLLPFTGVAHVAYLPGRRAVGFSRVVRLVDCFAHRLTLQESIAREVARALVRHLGARAAACALDAEQACVAIRGVRRHGSRVYTEAFAGSARHVARLRTLLGPARQRAAGRR